MSPLSLDNGWTDRNADCCVNTVVEEITTTATNLVNFGPVTPEILRRICMGGDCWEANIRTVTAVTTHANALQDLRGYGTVLVKGHSLGGSSIVD